jgi:hypothetical protein
MRIPVRLKVAWPGPRRASLIVTVAALAALAVSVSPAFAQSSWWRMTLTSSPSYLAPEGEGQIVVTATNFGDAGADGEPCIKVAEGAGKYANSECTEPAEAGKPGRSEYEKNPNAPVKLTDTLPKGLEAVSMHAEFDASDNVGKCVLKSLTCTLASTVSPYGQIEVVIGVKVLEDTVSGELNEASVSGAGTPGVSIARPITVSEEPTPFGLQVNELLPEEGDGVFDTQAGSHPFQITNTLILNRTLQSRGGEKVPVPAALAKNINVKLPPGLVGNPTPIPRCTLTQFLTLVEGSHNLCPPQTAVGVASVTVEELTFGKLRLTQPVFNLEPSFGEPARFGFLVTLNDTPVLLTTSVRSGNGEDYGITISSLNTTETANFLSSEITFWGVPNDPRHNNARGWGCLLETQGERSGLPCTAPEDQHSQSLLTLPTSCTGSPLESSAELDSWAQPAAFPDVPVTQAMPTLDGCNRLNFSPTVLAEPSTDRAAAPTGLNVNVDFHDEGLTSAEGLAQSQLNKTVVTLPEGLTINPSAGVGLGGCSPADYARESVDSLAGEGCPNDSKLGTVEIETPLLTVPIKGSLYIAQPYENPFSEPGHPNGSLVALYVVARNPEVGVLVKLAGKVSANPVTGQLTTTFENNPQLPFDHFDFHFREGQQAPLISPPTCGAYTTQAELTPWSNPTTELTDTSSFTITKGYDGGECPSGGVSPFKPGIEAGSVNNNAGSYSPFYVHLTRTDADSEISTFSTDLPEGVTGDLSGVPFCPEADIEAARHKTGHQEEAEPSCPAASQIGHTLVGTGVGAVLAYVPGKIYLAGPFHGAPFSIVSVTSADVGPFDLGTVVLRFGLEINPYTAKVSVSPTSSEPIPTIIDGIVTHVRDIRVYIDRPHFTLSPTSCNPLTISSTLSSSVGQSATVSSPYQASNCQGLPFQPQFSVSTSGKTSRARGASLAVKLSYPVSSGTRVNIAKVKVELPKALPSRLTTLQKACSAAQFEANPAGCPPASVVGHARATTPILPVALEGPAYFVSHGGEAFPSLIIVLQGYGVTVNLVGSTFINEKTGITSSTFKAVPDVPVGTFELTLPEGPFSALAAVGNLCKKKLAMPTEFVAQNGEVIQQSTKIKVEGCPKAKAKKRKAKKRAKHHGAKGHGKHRK